MRRTVAIVPLAVAVLGGSAVTAVGAPIAGGAPSSMVAKVPAVGVPTEAPVPGSQVAPVAPSWVKVEKKSTTSLRVWWAKVAGADGYVVYRWDARKKSYVAVKTLAKTSATSWVDTKRKTGKEYSYKVAAYRMSDGKKVVGAQSYWVSAVPYKKNARVVNAGTITPEDRDIGLTVSTNLFVQGLEEHCPLILGACVMPSKASRAKNKRVVDTTVRLMVVSGKNVARTTPSGFVFGLKPGRARVRVFAHNGAMKTITITVQDWVHAPFGYAGYREGSAERILLQDHGTQVQEVAHRAEQNTLKNPSFTGGTFFYDDHGELTCALRDYRTGDRPCSGGAPQALLTAIDALLDAFVFPMEISINIDSSGNHHTLDVQYHYWLTPDRSDWGGTLAYDPRDFLWRYDVAPLHPASRWKLLPAL